MSMTKKDYELIADTLLRTINTYKGMEANTMARGAEQVAYDIANRLANQNNKFDRDKFLKACGVA